MKKTSGINQRIVYDSEELILRLQDKSVLWITYFVSLITTFAQLSIIPEKP